MTIVPAAAADPIVNLGPYGDRVVLTELNVDEDGAHLTWQYLEAPCPCPPMITPAAATGFNVYRTVLVDGDGNVDTSPEPVKVNALPVPRNTSSQVYNFVDTGLPASSLTVYYVRPIYNGVEAAPSNPIGTYPSCTVAYISGDIPPEHDIHPECLIPDE